MLNKQTYDVIVRPLVTEKSSALKAEANKVVFEVKRQANKIDVKNAVEKLFDVKVEDVTTMIVRGKHKRVGSANYATRQSNTRCPRSRPPTEVAPGRLSKRRCAG